MPLYELARRKLVVKKDMDKHMHGDPPPETDSPSSSDSFQSITAVSSTISTPPSSSSTSTSSTIYTSTSASLTSSGTGASSTLAAGSQDNLSHSHVNAGAIAGGIFGALVFLALVVAGFIYLRRRRQRLHTAPSAEFLTGRQLVISPLPLGSSRAESFSSITQPPVSRASFRPSYMPAAGAGQLGTRAYPFRENLTPL